MPLTPGSKLGPYEILAPIGAGGMGEVYRARDAALGRDVAIKVLPAAFSQDADRLRRFKQEAQAAAALNHPNILTIYHIGENQGSPYIASELLEGESLRQRLQSGPLPLRKVVEYTTQIARGLAAAHDKGIIHRDLKPENIFVTRDGRAKILDFGLAKLTRPEEKGSGPDTQTLTSASEPGFVLGTVGYMSPEQVRGQAASPASDLFSFGAILHEMLTGRRAFRGETSADTMSAILKEDPPQITELNPQIPPALERIVGHCLEKNPDERFQSARDVAFNLEALSQDSGTSQKPTLPKAGSRSRRLRAVAATLTALALVAAGAFLLGRMNHSKPPIYQRLTYRQGTIEAARFTPDGENVIYSEALEGNTPEIFATNPRSPESRALGLKGGTLLSISSKGEMAILMDTHMIAPTYVAGTLARVPLEGGAPREIHAAAEGSDWTPDGSALLVTREVSEGGVIEFPQGKVIYRTSGLVGHARFSPRGDRIAFFEHPGHVSDNGDVAVVDLAGKKTTLSTGWSDLTGLAWSQSGDEIWFTGDRSNSSAALFAVSLTGKERQVERVPIDLVLYDIARDGRVLMSREDWRGGMYALGPGQDHERDLSWFDFTIATDISKDGRIVLFSEQGELGGAVVPAFMRGTDGTPAVRLSDGVCGALSRDTQRMICLTPDSQMAEVPTRTGELRRFSHDSLLRFSAERFSDEKRIAFLGQEPGHGPRIYVQDITGGEARAITPEGASLNSRVSPDSKWAAVAMGAELNTLIYPVQGGNPLQVPSIPTGEVPAAWSKDSRFLYTYRLGAVPVQIYQVDTLSGKRILWKTLAPPDPVGLSFVSNIFFSEDMKSYAYSINRRLDVLYLIEGLH